LSEDAYLDLNYVDFSMGKKTIVRIRIYRIFWWKWQ